MSFVVWADRCWVTRGIKDAARATSASGRSGEGRSLRSAPRSDPYVQLSGVRLPPRVSDGESLGRPGMADTRLWEPLVGQLPDPSPRDRGPVAAAGPRPPPGGGR